ncbi:hypothetical protein P8452_63244 [Trifolium repens]|nr:hypothetical protein P8452_63244 [Trifolium repens]
MAMSTALLMQPCPFHLKWKNGFSFPPHRIHIPHTFTPPIAISITKPHNTIMKCHLDCKSQSSLSSNTKSPLESLANTIWNMLRKPAAAAILIGFLLMYVPNTGLAASGGAMGGSSFSSSSDSSSYSSSDSSSDSWSCSSSSCSSSSDSYSCSSEVYVAIMLVLLIILIVYFLCRLYMETTTVLKYQVGLSGMGRSLQKDLNRIAEVADTSSPKGWSYVLSETTLALLRHPDYCISGYSSVSINLGIENAEERFNKLSTEERGKFDEETLVNLNNIKRQSTRSQGSNGLINEYLVITILVAAEGVLRIPSIKGRGKLKEALQKLGSIPPSKLLAVQVLWTPQSEYDTLSEQELLEDYPLLRPL